ncbi:MAG: chemotaxis response regulator protein-glutamate methylesterase [Pseudomonadota bacterium]
MKIGIVNDLPLAVEALRRALSLQPWHQIIWVAHNGAEAVSRCATETPDLILMDLVMPGVDGVEATRHIMTTTPCAILIVTVNVGTNAALVFEAMGCGALDAIDTPQFAAGNPQKIAEPFLAKIDAIDRLLRDRDIEERESTDTYTLPPASGLVAIGASAGGPTAVMTVLRDLPGDFPAAVVIIQHVDQQFARGMAEWLGRHSSLPVRLAKEGIRPTPGTVWLAGTDDHLVFKSTNRLGYTPEPRDYVYRPSVDVFFQSVIRYWQGDVVGVLLTGMGRDGALGLKALRDKGYYTIAQDRATSAVYGMPKAAADLGAAKDILPIDGVAAKLMNTFSRKT